MDYFRTRSVLTSVSEILLFLFLPVVEEGDSSDEVGGDGRLFLSSSLCSGLTTVPSDLSTTGNGS